MSRVLLLGAGGMLGFAMRSVFSSDGDIDLIWTERTKVPGGIPYEWGVDNFNELILQVLPDYVINCIGMIPQKCGKEASEVAYAVNYKLPAEIAQACERQGIISIEIGTDCVFSSPSGPHFENSLTALHDEYSKSKFAGEVTSQAVRTLRCSIIGSRPSDSSSLLGWFLSQPEETAIQGFTNHFWNGVTTLAYSKIVLGMVRGNASLPTSQALHIVPQGEVSKYELLNLFKESFGRPDVTIIPHETKHAMDRRLATLWPDANAALWEQAGYIAIPSVSDLVREMAEWLQAVNKSHNGF